MRNFQDPPDKEPVNDVDKLIPAGMAIDALKNIASAMLPFNYSEALDKIPDILDELQKFSPKNALQSVREGVVRQVFTEIFPSIIAAARTEDDDIPDARSDADIIDMVKNDVQNRIREYNKLNKYRALRRD